MVGKYFWLLFSLVLVVCATGLFREALRQMPRSRPITYRTGPLQVQLSPAVESIGISRTIEVHALTKELESKGQKIFSLCVGEPDYQPPEAVIRATATAAEQGKTKYTAVGGELSLRKEICRDLNQRKKTNYKPDEIIVSNGAKQSVFQALMSVVGRGDRVLIPSPFWTSYPDMVRLCGGEPVFLPTSSKNYSLSASSLSESLSSLSANRDRPVKALILCNPCNPTGCNLDRPQLQEIVSVLEKFPDITIISDEIYERLTYETDHVSLTSDLLDLSPALRKRIIVINGFSKSHSMTGYRVGYSATHSLELQQAMLKLQSQMTSSASSISQAAALAALTDPEFESWLRRQTQTLKVKRDFVREKLLQIPGIECPQGTGAFYLLPDVSSYFNKTYRDPDSGSSVQIKDAHSLCLRLLEKEGVAVVSGDAFGAENCLRLSYATSDEVLRGAMEGMQRFFSRLK